MRCPDHAALIDAVAAPDCDDATLLRYAEEVPSCPRCRRDLAIRLGAHPAVLVRGGRHDLAPVVGQRWLRALRTDLQPAARWPLGAIALAASALLIALALGPATPRRATSLLRVEAPPTVDVALQPAAAQAPVAAPPVPTPTPARPAPPSASPPVAVGPDDWSPPPVEDLRGATARSAPTGEASPRLEVRAPADPAVGDRVDFAVSSDRPTPLSVCVDGPERGVVWQGWVPAGRTVLTLEGQRQQFALATSGDYRFTLALALGGCAAPLRSHTVAVP